MDDEALGLIFKRIFHAIKKDMDSRMKKLGFNDVAGDGARISQQRNQ
jgi:hypothetical protein